MRKAHQRPGGPFEILQPPMVHQDTAMRPLSFVVEFVIAKQIRGTQLAHSRVVHKAQERRQNLLADFFREGLTFRHVFLAVPFRAMTKNLMDKDRSSTSV